MWKLSEFDYSVFLYEQNKKYALNDSKCENSLSLKICLEMFEGIYDIIPLVLYWIKSQKTSLYCTYRFAIWLLFTHVNSHMQQRK